MTWIFDRLFGPRPDIDEELLGAHIERAGELADHLAADAELLDRDERRRQRQRVPVTDGPTMASLAVVLADRLRRVDRTDDAGPRLTMLVGRRLPLTPADLGLLVELALGSHRFARRRIIGLVASAGERLSPAAAVDAVPAITRAVELLVPDRSATAGRLRSRLLGVLPPAMATLDALDILAWGDEWSRAVRPALARLVDGDPSLVALVELISSAAGPKPTASWLARADALLNACEGTGSEVGRLLLGGMVETPTSAWRPAVTPASVRLLRGAVRLAVLSRERWVAGLLARVYRQASVLDHPTGTLADDSLAGLARLGTTEAADRLAELYWAEPSAPDRAPIGRALDAAGRRLGTTRSALPEPHVPRVSWARIVRAERFRIESTLAEDRSWDLATWTTRYVEHPVIGRLARHLVWSIEQPPARWTGMPVAGPDAATGVGGPVDGPVDGPVGFVTSNGAPVGLDRGPTSPVVVIRPWHPLLADDAEIGAWRAFLAERKVTQPIAQVLRPVFRRSADETDDAIATYRFAERAIDLGRAWRFLRSRGWRVGAVPRREGPSSGEWAELVVVKDLGGRDLTRELRFSAPFGRLSPLVFSETLYDVSAMIERAGGSTPSAPEPGPDRADDHPGDEDDEQPQPRGRLEVPEQELDPPAGGVLEDEDQREQAQRAPHDDLR